MSDAGPPHRLQARREPQQPRTCSGSACPAAPLTVAALDSGVALGLLANGATMTVTLACTVN
ncbi:hypothetical protein K4L06_21350 [Lysobacter sp. BMK333-48F3]|uniref:hypothetical protein n=1 Tax=Lysobacter sp. BMK333-48F3 TaxID=2867962 RepID=UPI001C8B57AE|nr:hypothetical protein [Lysobacter sp. BMK333-48F3]MBX9403858.1 hypothetical protein [Lysobacter sp. BMK333-48F3]